MSSRYKGRIRYFEFWNEPDLQFANFTVDDYISLQKAGYRGVKSGNPEAVTMNGGLALITPSPHKHGLAEKIAAELGVSCDVFAFHGHGPFDGYVSAVKKLKALLSKKAPGKKWYSNETAMTSAGNNDYTQAVTLFKKLIFAWANGSIGYTWYDLIDDGDSDYNQEHHFGLLTHDFQPKSVYFVYNTLARHLGAGRYKQNLGRGKGEYIYHFSSQGNDYIALWRDDLAKNSVLVFATEADSVERIDIMDNARAVSIKNSSFIASAESEPVLYKVKGARRIEAPVQLLSYRGTIIPGVRANLELTGYNPSESISSFKFTFGNTGRDITIEPKQSRNLLISISIPSDKVPDLKWSFGEALFHGTIRPQLERAFLISPDKHEKADFELFRADQKVDFFPNDPNKLHLTWQGPNDLSAGLRMYVENSNMIIVADVVDNIHHQPCSGADIWKGDSIQMAFGFPGSPEKSCSLAFALGNDGKPVCYPHLISDGRSVDELTKDIAVKVERKDKTTVYYISIPLATLKIDKSSMESGFQFNFLVNDNDGICRKGYLELAPGIGTGFDTSLFPSIIMQK